MHQLVYRSRAKRAFSASDLQSMLLRFRSHNARLGITGILLHSWGNFLQLLEGERAQVEDLYAHIAEDPRHIEIAPVDMSLPRRMFADWSMGFVDLSAPARPVSGYAGFPSDLDLREIDHATILELLTFFSEQLPPDGIGQHDLSNGTLREPARSA
jgi:Sensors of blue-light using FAD